MNTRQITLVQQSFGSIAPDAERFTAAFYQRLFELDPGLRRLFPAELSEQGKKLAQVLGVAVGALERIETLLPTLHQLGRRHVAYGVQDHHYDTVGLALLGTLDECLGDAFTDEVRDAWVQTYAALSQAMKAGSDAGTPGGTTAQGAVRVTRAAQHGTRPAPVQADAYMLHVWARRQRGRLMAILIRRVVRKLSRKWRTSRGSGSGVVPARC